jgi:galactonate dehydratase
VKRPLSVENGYLLVPEAPGLGVELIDDQARLPPPRRKPLQTRLHEDGSVVDQ